MEHLRYKDFIKERSVLQGSRDKDEIFWVSKLEDIEYTKLLFFHYNFYNKKNKIFKMNLGLSYRLIALQVKTVLVSMLVLVSILMCFKISRERGPNDCGLWNGGDWRLE